MSDTTQRPIGLEMEDWFTGPDLAWASEVLVAMGFRHEVSTTRIREALIEARDLIAESGESAHDLFGAPDDFVAQHIVAWREEGLPYREEYAGLALGSGAVTTALAALVLGLREGVPGVVHGEPVVWRTGMTLAPLLLGALMALVQGVYRWAQRRWSQQAAVIATVGAGTLGVAATVTVFMWSGPQAMGSAWWYLLYLAVYLGGSAVVLRRSTTAPVDDPVSPADAAGLQPTPVDDATWARHTGAVLRAEGNHSDAQVDATLAEARSYAAASGRGLQEEFGTPASFAARIAPDEARKHRREATLHLVIAVVLAISAVLSLTQHESPWWWLGLAALNGYLGWSALAKSRRSSTS